MTDGVMPVPPPSCGAAASKSAAAALASAAGVRGRVGSTGRRETAGGLAGVPLLGDLLAVRQKFGAAEDKLTLQSQAAYFERRMPALGLDDRPALIESGTMSLKRTRSAGLLGGSKSAYHILGSFTAEPLVPDA